MSGLGSLKERADAADVPKPDAGHADRSGNEHDGLQRLGINDGPKPSEDRVNTGEDDDRHCPVPAIPIMV